MGRAFALPLAFGFGFCAAVGAPFLANAFLAALGAALALLVDFVFATCFGSAADGALVRARNIAAIVSPLLYLLFCCLAAVRAATAVSGLTEDSSCRRRDELLLLRGREEGEGRLPQE